MRPRYIVKASFQNVNLVFQLRMAGRTSNGYIELVNSEQLEICKGNVKELESLLLDSLK